MPQHSRKVLLNKLKQLKKDISGLESQIIEIEIFLHEHNKKLDYLDKLKDVGFRRVTKEKLRHEIDEFNQHKFVLIERLMEQRRTLEIIREGAQELV